MSVRTFAMTRSRPSKAQLAESCSRVHGLFDLATLLSHSCARLCREAVEFREQSRDLDIQILPCFSLRPFGELVHQLPGFSRHARETP